MSGSQFFDLQISSQINANNLFQPPRAPTISNSRLSTTQPLPHPSASFTTSRKRPRYDPADSVTPYSTSANEWSAIPSGPGSIANTPGCLSPSPFVNTQYRLAGGLDTPTAGIASSCDRYTTDQTYRTGRGWNSAGSEVSESYFPHVPSALAREGNGRGRGSTTASRTQNGWGKTVINAFGGVAGKVWDFCTVGAFRGFYAGGGQGYAMKGPYCDPNSVDSRERQDEYKEKRVSDGLVTTLSNGFRKSEFIPDYMSQDHTSRPAKRLHREDSSGLRAGWVLVGNPPVSRDSSPSRLVPRNNPPASTPSARHRNTQKPLLLPVSRIPRPASSASTRSPSLKPASGCSPLISPSRQQRPQTRDSRMLKVYESPKRNVDVVSQSPISSEDRKFKAQLRRREREGDRELRRFNKRLTDMIREGKAALGTTVEVFDGDEDEGYAEGEESDGEIKW